MNGDIYIVTAKLIDYAQTLPEARPAQEVAEGFIREMAQRVAADKNLDFDGMKQAVRTAIEIYEKEIAGGVVETNLDKIVDAALQKAKAQLDKGQSGLARATLRRAAEEMRREEQERRDQYEQGLRLLYTRERDIALAAYDGDAAAQAVIEMAEALHGDNHERLWQELKQEEEALYTFGRDQGSNVHLVASLGLADSLSHTARTPHERGTAQIWRGLALWLLGERESGTARLEAAVTAFLNALEGCTRDRFPLDWAMIQNNLGNALYSLGERASGTAYLQQAVSAYRDAIEEYKRDRVPILWAGAQHNLGAALQTLGGREHHKVYYEEAADAYRAALEERTLQCNPLDWAASKDGLGTTLVRIAAQEDGTARLEEAIAAHRAALIIRTRDRVPLDWAMTQNNLGGALKTLGERQSVTTSLREAIIAFGAALEELTFKRMPLHWANVTGNQGATMLTLAERTDDGALASSALAQLEISERVLREGKHEGWSRTFRNQIPAAKALVERLTAPTE